MLNKSSIKNNYIYNVIYQILLVLTPLITRPYLSKVFGADGIGRISFVESIASYFMLFAALGINTYGQREISYYQDDKIKTSEVFYNTFVLKLITSLVVLITYILLSIYCFKSYIYLAFAVSIISVLVDITWFFSGIEDFFSIVTRNVFFKILSIIYIFVFIKTKDDMVLYCISIGLFTLLSNLSLFPLLNKYLVKIDIKKIQPFKNFNIVLSLFLPTIAIQIYTVLDKTMIGLITKSEFENGYYEQSIKISRFLLLIVTALGTVTVPRVAYYYEKKDDKKLKELIYNSYRFVLMISIPMALGLYAISDNLVHWFLGSDFNKSIILLKIVSFIIIFIGLSNVTGIQYLVPTNKQNKLTFSVVIGAIINFSLNLVLINLYKSIGAAISSVIAECVIALIQFYIVKDEISLIKVLKNAVKYFVSAVCMFCIIMIIAKYLDSSFINTIIITIVGSIIYFAILIILKDDFLLDKLPLHKKYID